MSFRTDLLAAIAPIRRIPQEVFDIRQYTVTLRVSTWSGPRIGVGTETVVDTPLTLDGTTRPRLREVSSKEILASGGKYSDGDFKVGPLTPNFGPGGVDPDYFNPSATNAKREVRFIVNGPGLENVACKLVDTDDTRPFSYLFTLRRTNNGG